MKKCFGNIINSLKTVRDNTPKRYFAVMIWEMLAENAGKLLGIVVPALIVDRIVSKGAASDVLLWAAAYAGIVLLTDTFRKSLSLFSTAYWYKAANLATFNVCEKGMRISCAELDSSETLDEYNRAMRSPWEFLGIDDLLVQLSGAVLTILEMAYILSRVHILVTAAVLMLSVLYAVSYRKKTTVLHNKEKEIQNAGRRSEYPLRLLQDHSYGKEVRIYDMYPLVMEHYHRLTGKEMELVRDSGRYAARTDTLLHLIDAFRLILVYGSAVHKYLFRSLSLGSFAMYYGTLKALSDSLNTLFQICTDIRECSLYYEDYEKFISRDTDGTDDPVPANDPAAAGGAGNGSIEFLHVDFTYPGSKAEILHDMCFSIKQGEHIAIVGDNGAGKSTLVKLLTRLYEPTSGQIKMDGSDIRDIPREDYFSMFAPVFQDFELYCIPIGDNIAFLNAETDSDGIWKALQNSGSEELIRSLPSGLDTKVSKMLDARGVEFSGGESQRLAIARAHYKNAPVLILDEPTAALDPIAEEEIYRYIHDMTKEKTTIYISHRISTTRHADRIMVVGEGHIREFGTFEELMENRGLYYEMFRMQAAPYAG